MAHHLHSHIRRLAHSHFGRDASPHAQSDTNLVAATTVPQGPSPVELIKRESSTPLSTTTTSVTLPIALGIAIPVIVALILFVILHRRHLKKLRIEDANDQAKSLDYGMEGFGPGGKKANKGKNGRGPAAAAAENSNQMLEKSIRGRGISMDMDMAIGGSPYILPPEMHGSRESLHSLSRNMTHVNDPYRLAYSRSNSPSIFNSPRVGADNASTMTGSTMSRFRQDGMDQNLARNAQRMSRTGPPTSSQPSVMEVEEPVRMPSPPQPAARKESPPAPQAATSLAPEVVENQRVTSVQDVNVIRQSHNYLGAFIHSREASVDGRSSSAQSSEHPHEGVGVARSPPPRGQSLHQDAMSPLPAIQIEQETFNAQNFEFNEIVVPPSPDAASRARGPEMGNDPFDLASPDTETNTDFYTPAEHEHNPMGEDYYNQDHGQDHNQGYNQGLGVSDADFLPNNRLSIMRPLPPDDPNDNPEQRANRIRSFYKEYFSEAEARTYATGAADYVEDYGSEWQGDATIFDPQTGQFVMAQAPYAEPVMRRAMTPPPRGPPRFQGPGGYHNHNNSNPGPFMPRGRAYSNASTSRLGPGPGPGGRRGPPPRRPMAAPKALRTLPTPHQLKEDAFALPIDFAPPQAWRDRQAGRPESPISQPRPFSPAVPIASPLTSAFEELPAMPSPHLLRKSGTFTALDFAPPPRFRDRGDNASDNGSIRSGRSGRSAMSAAQVHTLRAGAYRVSRIPTDLVSTKNDLANMLKPTWQVHA